MKEKRVVFYYETINNIENFNKNIDFCLNDLQKQGAEILDVKNCFDSKNNILITIIYELDIPIHIEPKNI